MTLQLKHCSSKIITFQDESLPNKVPLRVTANAHNLIDNSICGALVIVAQSTQSSEEAPPVPSQLQAVLKDYAEIFQQPTELPPTRFCDHAIPLTQDAKVIN